MKLHSYILLAFILLFGACSTPIPSAIKVETTKEEMSYLKNVKPILDKRCVTCHSCYNSPCQAKLSSFEGADRGASKIVVYDAARLSAIEPTRLFVDAHDTKEWRKKGFYSTTLSKDSNATHNDSIMMHLLYDKKQHPELIGEYAPESDHFWIMFKNPKHDITVTHPELLAAQKENLRLPIDNISGSIFTAFTDSYKEGYEAYYQEKKRLEAKLEPQGVSMESIWKGNRAGYNVFGNLAHQTYIRRYTDFLRAEAELNFIEYMHKRYVFL